MLPIRNHHGELLEAAFHQGLGDRARPDRLIILSHGLTGNMNSPLLVAVADNLARHGWPCLRLSFSGNGNSEGIFTESNISKEIAELGAVIDQLGTGKKIACIGHSMGAAVGALTAARDDRIRMMVSLAGMVHTRRFVEKEFSGVTPGGDNMWEDPEFPLSVSFVEDLTMIGSTLDAVNELRLPWVLLHGLEDDVVLPMESRELHAKLRGPSDLVEIEGADHSFEGYYEHVCAGIRDGLEKFF